MNSSKPTTSLLPPCKTWAERIELLNDLILCAIDVAQAMHAPLEQYEQRWSGGREGSSASVRSDAAADLKLLLLEVRMDLMRAAGIGTTRAHLREMPSRSRALDAAGAPCEPLLLTHRSESCLRTMLTRELMLEVLRKHGIDTVQVAESAIADGGECDDGDGPDTRSNEQRLAEAVLELLGGKL
jgi:hypothetical protein